MVPHMNDVGLFSAPDTDLVQTVILKKQPELATSSWFVLFHDLIRAVRFEYLYMLLHPSKEGKAVGFLKKYETTVTFNVNM